MVNSSLSLVAPCLSRLQALPLSTSQSDCACSLSRQPSVSTAAARDGFYLEWEQGSEGRRLADGRQTKPDVMSCSGFPKGCPLSPWAVTQSTTHTHTRMHTHRRSNLPAGVRCLTACLYVCLYRLPSEPYWRACNCSHCSRTTLTLTPPPPSVFLNGILSHTCSFPSSCLFLSSSVVLAKIAYMQVSEDGDSNSCWGGG